jgi:deazaflavin-dependent oxidoreductase (nitroreductase family)
VPNPLASRRFYHKLSNIFIAPWFRILPAPKGFAFITVTGRRSGKPRGRPIRAIRKNGTLYAVVILGERSDWLRNVRAQPQVRIKLGGRTRPATVRELPDGPEREKAATMYADTVVFCDYIDFPSVHWSFPTRRKIVQAHREWTRDGVLVAIDLEA